MIPSNELNKQYNLVENRIEYVEEIDFVFTCKDRSKIYLVSYDQPIIYKGKKAVQSIIKNITEKKKK